MDIREVLNRPEYDFIKTNPHLGGSMIFATFGGSHAYGTNTPDSDIDVRGCALNSRTDILGRTNFEQVIDNATDTTIYSFNKLIHLLSDCNPNTIELLGCKSEQYVFFNDIGRMMVEQRDMFRVIIAGGRDYNNYAQLERAMDRLLSNITDEIVIVCGMARGADTLGEQYGKQRGYRINYFPADWKTFGKSAGYIRNQEMAENADALVAFWDGKSRGTASMIDLAHRYNLRVRIVRYKQE